MLPYVIARKTRGPHIGTRVASIKRLVDALAHRPAWVITESASSDRDALQQICTAYASIDYATEDTVNTSIICLGLAGVSADVLKRADTVNTAKAALRAVCAPLQRINMRVPVKGDDGPTKVIPVIRVILRNIQRSDLNLLAAYRKIPILDAPPATITYTRANTRAVYRKSLDDLHDMLANLDGPTAAADSERLMTLGRRETHLALVKDRYQNIRANVLYARLDPRGRGRMQISAELPLMYAIGRRTEHPEVQFPTTPAAASSQPQRARQSKLEARPFLQSLPVYRYTMSTASS